MSGRLIVGFIIGVSMISSLLLGKWCSMMLFGFITIFGVSEYLQISFVMRKAKYSTIIYSIYTSIAVSVYIVLVSLWSFSVGINQVRLGFLPTVICLSCAYFILRIVNLYFPYKHNLLREFVDVMMYLPVPMSLALWIGSYDNAFEHQILLSIIIFIWASDIGAYYIGKNFGRTKLLKRISPQKTWEGALGGLGLTLICACIISLIVSDLNQSQWLNIAFITWIFGLFGDLIESQYKRQAEIKDSGRILGDHGGILDRFDSLLSSIPFVALYLWLIQISP